mmetsp:Transcript_6194/g.11194  ORF Transcript_6194/g.11194 Transcript_6194/m.11194 type:complete len:293 (+) Transcript_6194:213-1091(+)
MSEPANPARMIKSGRLFGSTGSILGRGSENADLLRQSKDEAVDAQSSNNDQAPPHNQVFLNVYDLKMPDDPSIISRWNYYLYWSGLGGLFHSGVEVTFADGTSTEYAYGGHVDDTTGIFEHRPKCAPEAVFRESIPYGTTCWTRAEITKLNEAELSRYTGRSYNLLSRNCNHFSAELLFILTGKQAPTWVNRMAWIGTQMPKCLFPPGFENPIAALAPVPETPTIPVSCGPTVYSSMENMDESDFLANSMPLERNERSKEQQDLTSVSQDDTGTSLRQIFSGDRTVPFKPAP